MRAAMYAKIRLGCLCLALACGGKSRQADGVSAAGTGGQPDQSSCPTAEPAEGESCTAAGLTCSGFGSLSCPETARCTGGVWRIECPQMPFGTSTGSCACAHPIGADAGANRIPLNHRASGEACPKERAAQSPTPISNCTQTPGCMDPCEQDSDCTQGVNGRCGIRGPAPVVECSYDECATDADCPSRTPCLCRESSASSAANSCALAADCAVDTDCGPGGFCSPSMLNQSCGATYHCHTSADTCIDDSDCPNPSIVDPVGCNFDSSLGHFVCNPGCSSPPA
ncbi:MAG TPA: hypothetical protein VGI10_02890 [Polyangiaceae bacterium]